MPEPTQPSTTILLASLFRRMEKLEEVVRVILSQARISALFTFRGEPEKRVVMDFTNTPARVNVDDKTRTGNIFVTIQGDIMHKVLLGLMKPGAAVGQREMLLRGSAADLAKFIPLFDFAPLLYGEHLADLGANGFARPSGQAPLKEAVMSGQIFLGDPIPVRTLSHFEKAIFKLINGLAWGIGYAVGIIRYRLLQNLSLFEVLTFLSRGLEAAMPKRRLVENTSGTSGE